MQHIGALPRLGAQAIILAFVAFMLVAIGCTGSHASPNEQAASISASPAFNSSGAGTFADAVGHALPSCIPGRNKVRVERNAVPPSQAHLHHSPVSGCTGLFAPARAEGTADQFSGRTPTALTHLDLGIVRT
ncbi:hypothetical protein [Arthrobacter sp.]|uniref:hypothetical protein n=1 Tax=Arthrobacter sp. TaxID=1667 RepID=UPI0026E002C5|nr:hypothetical protein [Arthrobacter sp.]MDO5751951.1 hypothetical protein [Arthrobacter sp.]